MAKSNDLRCDEPKITDLVLLNPFILFTLCSIQLMKHTLSEIKVSIFRILDE